MWTGVATWVALTALALQAPAQESAAIAPKPLLQPTFSIWDAVPGMPLAEVPEIEIVETACGTNGGPPSTPLKRLADFRQCPPEASGLREIHFAYDDEQDYVARALDLEYEVLRGGTTIYAYKIVASMLVDEDGIIRGIRAVTDNRIDAETRRNAVGLAANLKLRFKAMNLACRDLPPRVGEQPVGSIFIHEVCTGEDATTVQRVRIESSYLRKRGQEGLNRETRQVNRGYFQSETRFELVSAPYEPASAPS